MAIGFIGSSFFIGTFVGSFILPRVADIIGRKPMYLLGIVLFIISVIGLMLSTSISLLYAFLILAGVAETGKYYVAYVYAIEIMPKRLQNYGGLAIFFVFATAKVIICLYFWQSSSSCAKE